MTIIEKIRQKKAKKQQSKKRKTDGQKAYREYCQSERFKELTQECFERDNFKCRLCSRPAEVAHHRQYPKVWGTETVDSLTSLCGHCHLNFHKPLGLETAKLQLQEHLEEGIDCPVCEQLAKKWNIKLHSGMAYWLVLLVRQYQTDNDWISVKELNHRAGMRGGDYAKLKHWDLVEQATTADISKRASGFWKPTQLGVDFVNSICLVPRSVWTYDGELLEIAKEQTTIKQALGDKFDYSELMDS